MLKVKVIDNHVKHGDLVKLIYIVAFFALECVYCLLQVISFCLFFMKELCNGRMLVLFYVFIGLCFMRWILNLWVCSLSKAIYDVEVTKMWEGEFKLGWVDGRGILVFWEAKHIFPSNL